MKRLACLVLLLFIITGCATVGTNLTESEYASYATGLRVSISPNVINDKGVYQVHEYVPKGGYFWHYTISITNITDKPLKFVTYQNIEHRETSTVRRKFGTLNRFMKHYNTTDPTIKPGQTIVNKKNYAWYYHTEDKIKVTIVYRFIFEDETGKKYKGESSVSIDVK